MEGVKKRLVVIQTKYLTMNLILLPLVSILNYEPYFGTDCIKPCVKDLLEVEKKLVLS